MLIDQIKIARIIENIEQTLASEKNCFEDIGIKTGKSGLALYKFVTADHFDVSDEKNLANRIIEDIFIQINTGYSSNTIFEELADFGYFLTLCEKKNWIQSDFESTLSELDSILERHLLQLLEEGNLDPAIGAIKFGYYFLQRGSKAKKGEELILAILERIVHNCKANDKKGIYWVSNVKNEESVYFGISHGSAAFILFLLAIRETIKNVQLCEFLIKDAAEFVLQHEQKNAPLFFPIMLDEPDRVRFPNYWCYGDLGTLYSLIKAELAIYSEIRTPKLINILHQLCDRVFDERFFTEGYSLLYGWCGLAMLYKKLAGLLNDEKCMVAYNNIVAHIIRRFNPDEKYFGYPGSWNQNKKSTNLSFSEGLIGISIFLLSVTDSEYEQYFENYFNM